LLVVVGAYAQVAPSFELAGLLGVAALISLLWSKRARLGNFGQILLGLAVLSLSIAATTSVFVPREPVPGGTLRAAWNSFAVSLLALGISRLYLAAPAGGASATLGLGLFALAACGGAVVGPGYTIAVALFLVLAVLARRASDPARGPLAVRAARTVLASSLGVVLGVGSVVLANELLPVAHGWVLRQIMHSGIDRSGFTARLSLGSMRGLAMSDEVVLRIRGAATDYLRGAVLTRYQAGLWVPSDDTSVVTKRFPRLPTPSAGLTEIELVQDDPERYFLPLHATNVAVSAGLAAVDRAGVLSSVAAAPADRYWFAAEDPAPALSPPTAGDRELEPTLAPVLRELALRWSEGAADSRGRLAAVEHQLQTGFRYSLEFDHTPGADPVLEFLFSEKRGHCEYFASVMVLMARALGVPARLVTGYRVSEYSELGGYYLVRERNAHAWVEAWDPTAGWTRYDPTPPADLALAMPVRSSLLSALGDLLRSWWAVVLRWLDQRTPLEIVSALLSLVALGIGLRTWRAWRRGRAQPERRLEEPPLACFAELARGLSRVGLGRAPHEPIERLAARVLRSRLPAELRDRAARLVLRYAALRYGGLGEPQALAKDVAQLLERLAAARTSAES